MAETIVEGAAAPVIPEMEGAVREELVDVLAQLKESNEAAAEYQVKVSELQHDLDWANGHMEMLRELVFRQLGEPKYDDLRLGVDELIARYTLVVAACRATLVWACKSDDFSDFAEGVVPLLDIAVRDCTRDPFPVEMLKTAAGMTLMRAQEINKAICDLGLHSIGVVETCPDLFEYSLAEMLAAAHVIAAWKPEPNENGTTSIPVHPDDRLVAAAYAWANFPAETGDHVEPIVMGHRKALVCIQPGPSDEDGEEDEEE